MHDTPLMRLKAWERAKTRGFITEIAASLGVRVQTARRWFLEPDHPQRRAIRSQQISAALARSHDLQPNDFIWLYGERAARRRARQGEQREAVL